MCLAPTWSGSPRMAASGSGRRDGTSFESDPINVAVESGFYDVSDGSGGTSSEVEEWLARVEGPAHTALTGIDQTSRPPAPGSEAREKLALFLALQMTRTTQHRERVLFPKRVADWAGDRRLTKDLVADYLRTEHLGFAPHEREVEGAFSYVSEHLKDPGVVTPTFAVEMMFQSADELVGTILALKWTVEKLDGRGGFITSDVPVIPWRKVTRRDNHERARHRQGRGAPLPSRPQQAASALCRNDRVRMSRFQRLAATAVIRYPGL